MSLRKFSASRSAADVPAASPLYLHCVSRPAPEVRRSTVPFGMEERGIDGRSLVLAWDCGELRLFFTVLRADSPLRGRGAGVPLARSDASRLRGVHESIVNDLRLHGMVLPFAFGTVVHGWKELQDGFTAESERIAGSLSLLAETRRWTLTVSVLDARFLELHLHDTPEKRREADRQRVMYGSRPQGGKPDARTLERIIARERQLAQAVHAELEPLADHANVLSEVAPQSGFSADWKPVLTASYEIHPRVLRRFERQVTDLQYQYLLQEPLIHLAGDVESLVLPEKA